MSEAIAGDPVTFTAGMKQKWIAALRSGEFKQGTNYFRTPRGAYCCLGVLCEVIGLKINPGGASTDMCRPAVSELIGDAPHAHLIGMNDIENKSFAEIADYIEANIPAVDHQSAAASSEAVSEADGPQS